MDNEILLELLESYIEEHEISTREILEAVNNSASYLLKYITKELVKKTSKRFDEKSEPEEGNELDDDEEEEEKKTEHVEIPKPKIRIIGTFNAADRLDELDEVPRLENGDIDYWLASKMLCEKDGGRLPTMKELAEIASYMYQTEICEFVDKYGLEVKNELIPIGLYWSSSEFDSTYAYYRYFYDDSSYWGRYYTRSNSGFRSLCVGD